jgi:hypothetical protein
MLIPARRLRAARPRRVALRETEREWLEFARGKTIPPALRRAVLLRDQRCCQVPGCANSRWLGIHHLELRSEGGDHSPENLACLCS